jgi:hypothetical protein
MTYDFSGKVVVITGGTGALGRAVAQAFSTSNATTVVSYIIVCYCNHNEPLWLHRCFVGHMAGILCQYLHNTKVW